MSISARRSSTGRVKSTRVCTTRSRRLISLPITSMWRRVSGSISCSFCRNTSRWTTMALMGFFTSWATPEVSLPMAARRRESSISSSIRWTDSASRRVSSAPMRSPRSSMKSSEICRRRPFSVSISSCIMGLRISKASRMAWARRVSPEKMSAG